MISLGRSVSIAPGDEHAIATDIAVARVRTVLWRDGERRTGLELGRAPRPATIERDRFDQRRLAALLRECVDDRAVRLAELHFDVVGQLALVAVTALFLVAV